MTAPIRLRARLVDGVVKAQLLMLHPMETGLRVDADGIAVAAHYITEVQVTLGERTVFAARLSRAVSQDPLIHFRFKGAEAGQRLSVSWTDSRGLSRRDEATIA